MHSCCRVVCHSTPLEMIFVNPVAKCMEVSQYSRLNVLFSSARSHFGNDLVHSTEMAQFCAVPRSCDCDCSLIVLFKFKRDCHVGGVLGISWRFRTSPNSALATVINSASVVDRAVEPCFLDDQRIGKYTSPVLII